MVWWFEIKHINGEFSDCQELLVFFVNRVSSYTKNFNVQYGP